MLSGTRQCYFFGVFNPIQNAHLAVGQIMHDRFKFDKVVFVPTFAPPHKQNVKDMASFEDRVKMLELATAGKPYFSVSRVEETLPAPNYTINTLKKLFPQFIPLVPGSEDYKQLGFWNKTKAFVRYWVDKVIRKIPFLDVRTRVKFIFGTDELNSLAKWSKADVLAKRLFFLVGIRNNETPIKEITMDGETIPLKYKTFTLEPHLHPISSTGIRNAVRDGQSVDGQTPQAVIDYIHEKKLYQNHPPVFGAKGLIA